MDKSREKKRVGIASMLEKSEIKEYFDTFFILVFGIEFVIFVAHFIGSIGPEKGAFLWKQYFFVSFIAPVVLTFLIGLIIIGFNYYIFGEEYVSDSSKTTEESDLKGKKLKYSAKNFILLLHQMPVLAGLFTIGLGSVVLYKLDIILQLIGHVGERTAFYVFIILAVLVAGALIFLLFWMFWKFRLHKLEIERRWEFKKRVMEKSGLIILENNVVLNEEGKVMVQGTIDELPGVDLLDDEKKKLAFLPDKFMLK